ncbi:hypothetical protein FKM82_003208 [Ascaphus truei]
MGRCTLGLNSAQGLSWDVLGAWLRNQRLPEHWLTHIAHFGCSVENTNHGNLLQVTGNSELYTICRGSSFGDLKVMIPWYSRTLRPKGIPW